MKNKEVKSSKKNQWILILEIICVIVFIYAASQLWMIFQDYQRASNEYDALAEQVLIEIEEKSDKNTEIFNEKKEQVKEQSILDLPYDYDIPSYSVDLLSVKAQNADTVGWIILPDTKINYPIVKSKDNTEYLTTTFEGQTANSGAIFLDMYCESDFSNQNNIIYGHNMKNGSMFRALNNMTDKEYFWRHHIFCIDIGNGFEEYEVISCYETTENDLSSWQIGFESKEAYGAWLKNVTDRCTYDCAYYDVNKNTVTLSTCRGKSGGPGRFIVHLQKK
jgi:sortase B